MAPSLYVKPTIVCQQTSHFSVLQLTLLEEATTHHRLPFPAGGAEDAPLRLAFGCSLQPSDTAIISFHLHRGDAASPPDARSLLALRAEFGKPNVQR